MATAPIGRRNAALNRAAFNLGQLVAGGLLAADQVGAVLLAALGCAAGQPSSAGDETVMQHGPRRAQVPTGRPRARRDVASV